MARTTHITSLILGIALSAMAHAQSDSTLSTGGPEGRTPYEGYDLSLPEEEIPVDVMTSEDSARSIPSHLLYGEFDTDVIFDRKSTLVMDTSTLFLSHSACDNAMPICGKITSAFGHRHQRMHYGVDLKLQEGDPVHAAFDGMVRISRYHPQFGNVVVVRHANGLETLYGHLSARIVEAGDAVEAGQVIGLGGNTGRSTGSHLHFETRYLGHPIDPQLLFDLSEGTLRSTTLHVHPGLFAVPKKAAAAARTHRWHVVRRGDTLSAIARRYRTSVPALCKANRIGRSSKLRPGQRLKI
jgi:murein DD-endopeptidase MepM/ murein hydrolase activator NlpD